MPHCSYRIDRAQSSYMMVLQPHAPQVLWLIVPGLQAQLGVLGLTVLMLALALTSSTSSWVHATVRRGRRLWAVHGANPAMLGLLACACMSQQKQQHLGEVQGLQITAVRCEQCPLQTYQHSFPARACLLKQLTSQTMLAWLQDRL